MKEYFFWKKKEEAEDDDDDDKWMGRAFIRSHRTQPNDWSVC
jgi:hypothetical protein